VLTVGAELRDRVIELGVPGERVHALRRGVDARLFHPGDRQHSRRRLGLPGEPRILLWVGRMVPVKGLEVLIAAGARLRERGVAFQMYLVGDGPLAGRVRSWIRAAGCAHVAHLVGPVDHDRLPDWYRAADITVLSSHSEGVPNVLLESLACGTPFVATRVGGIPEIAGESSDLVPPGDADALAGALARRLSSAVPAPPPAPDGRSPDDSASALVALVRALRERRKSAAAGPVP
jgi:glycosyltransferase involved in cell wall biosynthesis